MANLVSNRIQFIGKEDQLKAVYKNGAVAELIEESSINKDNTIQFITNWNPINEVIENISLEFPDVTIIYEYAEPMDETVGGGIYVYKNGLVTGGKLDVNDSTYYDLVFKLIPSSKENFSKEELEEIYSPKPHPSAKISMKDLLNDVKEEDQK